jgi:hypothetical protein
MMKRRQTGRSPNPPHPFDQVDWEQRVPGGELTTLWDQTGDLHATRVQELDADGMVDLIRRGPVRLVRCDWVGPLRWTEAAECYRFWKKEVKPHLCEDLRGHQTPAGYCYSASEWHLLSGEVVILLEVDH